MRNVKLILLIICIKSLNVFGQNNFFTNEPNLYYYKNYDDFFSSSNKIYAGKYVNKLVVNGNIKNFKCLDTITNKKFKVDFSDSANIVGINYEFKNCKFIRDNNKDPFYMYICGNKKLLVVYTCCVTFGKFDENGELLMASFMADQGSYFYFVKDLDFEHKKKAFEDIIEDNPKLHDQFMEEKKENKKAFQSDHISFYKKYIKLYCASK